MINMKHLHILLALLFIYLPTASASQVSTRNNTCYNVYHVQNLQQSCCINGSGSDPGKAIEELRAHVAALQAKLQDECDAFKVFSCDSDSGCYDRKLWYLQSRSPAKYPYSGFCRAMSMKDPQTAGSYSIRMDLVGIHGCDKNDCGYPGFMFNAQDPFTFEYVFFAPHVAAHCYRHGYYQNGKTHGLAIGPCKNGIPKMNTWFSIQMQVMSNTKTALLYRDGGLVGEVHPHFPATRWGGALTINGYQDLSAFRNYKLTTI